MDPRMQSLGRFVLGTVIDATLLGAIVTGWYVWPDDPDAQEGLAFVLPSLLGLAVLTAGWGLWEGWRGLRVSWSLLRWAVACIAPTIGVQIVGAVEGVLEGGNSFELAAEWLFTYGSLLVLVLPGAVIGAAVGGLVWKDRPVSAAPR